MSHDAAFHLAADDPTVKSLVGDRVYQMFVPQGAARPYVVFQRISHARDDFTFADGHADIEGPVYQYSCYGEDANEAQAVAAAITAALENSDRADVAGAFPQSLLDDYETGPEGSEEHVCVTRVEAEIRLVTT